jgi:hypothetical protein
MKPDPGEEAKGGESGLEKRVEELELREGNERHPRNVNPREFLLLLLLLLWCYNGNNRGYFYYYSYLKGGVRRVLTCANFYCYLWVERESKE